MDDPTRDLGERVAAGLERIERGAIGGAFTPGAPGTRNSFGTTWWGEPVAP
jgi:hypothetical protein